LQYIGNIPFKQLSQKPVNNSENECFDPRTINHSINEEVNKPFTTEEVSKLIRKLRNNKASGIDNIINEYLKHCPKKVMEIIVKLFNIVLESGVIPSEWCIGMINPIYKNKGSMDEADNYRGITLLSCVGKLFTACLNSRLSYYLEATGTLGEEQAGFRENYSTTDHTFVLHALIDLYLHRKKRLYCAFVDYKKAFDLIDRSSLWSKLIGCGINGNVIRVIYNLYDNAKSCVKIGAAMSEFFACNIGVRQGENLSPLLFAVFLNDFEFFVSRNYNGLNLCATEIRENLSDDDVEVFIRLYVLLYADDTIIMAETDTELQLALTAVNEYCKLWHLTVNTTKTKIVIFSRGKVKKFPNFNFGDRILKVVDDYIYLGTTFNFNGSFNKAIAKQVSQARRAMFNLITKARTLSLPVDIQSELFDQLVTPILLYGCEVWGFHKLDQIEVFYRKFLKNLLGVHKGTANCMAYGELGKFPLTSMIEKRMVCFWLRLCQGKASKLSHIMYTLLHKLHSNTDFEVRWIAKVKEILDKSGLSNVWDQPEHVNSKWFKECIELRLSDIDKQNLHAEITRNRLCTNYRIFKQTLGLERHLVVLDFIDRKNLSRFRCGIHRLPIAEGRFIPNQTIKMCNMCNSQDQGDEYHYILVCPAFNDLRKMYLKQYYTVRPNVLKMSQLFNVTSTKQLANLAKFCKLIMDQF